MASDDDAPGEAPSLELVQRLLQTRGPEGMKANALHWSSYFRIHHRQVATLRARRVFVAGDAAHIHSPFGGQGMNMGLQDAWNLAWKLALAVQGSAREALLDSYTLERRPVIQQVIDSTGLLTQAMATPGRAAQGLRNALIPLVAHLPPVVHAVVDRLSGLALDYRGSPIIDGTGRRYLGAALRGGGCGDARFLLVGDQREEMALRQALDALPGRLRAMVDLRIEPREDIILVRPDGYVACSSHRHSPATLARELKTVLERQLH